MTPDGGGTEFNQILILLGVLLSPVITFIGVEWRSERRQKWAADTLRAERETAAAELAARREADRLERAQIAELLKAQLEIDNQKLRHAIGNQIANVSLKTEALQRKMDENTRLTEQTGQEALKALTEANHLNAKIAEQGASTLRASLQWEELQKSFNRLLTTAAPVIVGETRLNDLQETADRIEEVTTDTQNRVQELTP